MQDELEKRRQEVERLEEAGRLPRSLPTWQLVQMAVEAEMLRSRAKVGGKAPYKEFLRKGALKKSQRYWPGTVSLHKICWYQMSTELLIPKGPVVHLICETAQECRRYDMCFHVCVVMVLQEAAEYYLTSLLEDANL